MLKSEAVLAVSPLISSERNEILEKLQFRIKSVLTGQEVKIYSDECSQFQTWTR